MKRRLLTNISTSFGLANQSGERNRGMQSTSTVEPPGVDFARVANELELSAEQAANVAALLDEGNTVPFITRYRKERTGNLDEVQIRAVAQRVAWLRQLAERAQTILRLIGAQGALTPQLREQIEAAETLKRLEDLYLPFRPKRKSRGMLARSRGLEPLAERIWQQDDSLEELESAAADFVDAQKELPTTSEVLQGAADILAERISENAEVRAAVRETAWRTGRLKVTATPAGMKKGQEYRNYFDYVEPVSTIPPHRCLALNRGEKEGCLRVKFEWDPEQAKAAVLRPLRLDGHRLRAFLEDCISDALSRLIQPSLDREIRRDLSDTAESHAVSVFAANLKNLLLQPPLTDQRVLAIDPGFRSGCKLALLDELGNCLAIDVIYVTGSAEKRHAARETLVQLMKQHGCDVVAIGNGTACRECEELISEIIAAQLPEARYTIVNEAGASIYSTSAVAREEFPDRDATVRGTISIGRRLQDPLSELVKIEPQHIGVGMYQHDVSARRLRESLDSVVESCVNYVGVDLNTASASLLRYVSGFNQLVARRVVEWRSQNGRFNDRRQLLEVPGIGETTFMQATGFLKITGGGNPLDATWIHPESYEATRRLLARLSMTLNDLTAGAPSDELQQRLLQLDAETLSQELQVGVPTCRDIVDALARPGRDPRCELPGPVFRRDVLKLGDLQEGMELTGTVLNVVDFGAFVDIGLKDSGLVHISQLSDRYVRSPHEMASVGDVVTVWVLSIDEQRRRVSLTMIPPGTARKKPRRKADANGTTQKQAQPAEMHADTQHKQRSKTARTKRRGRGRGRKRADGPAPELTDEMRDGLEPLKSFDQLKELWKKRKS